MLPRVLDRPSLDGAIYSKYVQYRQREKLAFKPMKRASGCMMLDELIAI